MLVKTEEGYLFFERRGEGPALIMLHGNGDDHCIFDKASDVLYEHFTLYLVDSRDHGDSSVTNNLHYSLMADDIIQLIKKRKLNKPILYGFSDGGIIGLLIAIKEPDLLSHLIISGANSNPNGIDDYEREIDERIYENTHSPLKRLMLTEPCITKDDLKKIKCPVLVTAGECDVIKEEDTRFIAENIPCSKLKIIEGEDHSSYIVDSKEIAKIILEELQPSLAALPI